MTPRPCKFCSVECSASDRGRADCYVCSSVRAALSSYSRLCRDNMALERRVRELEAQLAALQPEVADGPTT